MGVSLAVLALTAVGCKSPERSPSFFGDLGLVYRSQTIKRVNNMPLAVRDVPKHPDDGYASNKNVAPIARDSAYIYGRLGFNPRVGLAFPLDGERNFEWKVGLGAEISGNLGMFKEPDHRSDLTVRNYTTDPGERTRGYGAALTYHQTYTALGEHWNTFFFPQLFTELEARLSDNIGLAVGFTFWYEQLWVENGWDRYDRYQTRNAHRIADIFAGIPYLSLRFDKEKKDSFFNAAVDIGYVMPLSIEKRGFGKEMEITENNHGFFIGLRHKF